MLLKDKIAIVTGGGVGIGNAIAVRYAKEGAHVVVAEINEVTGQQTAKEVSAHDRRGLFVKTDMGNLSHINAMVAKAVETFGRIDILMNNAGVNKQLTMTRIAASQLAPHNINVNAICPGATRSEMYDTIVSQIVERDKITEAEAISRIDVSIPLRRSNTGEDVANIAAFLASEESRNITGQSLNVDGGLMWD